MSRLHRIRYRVSCCGVDARGAVALVRGDEDVEEAIAPHPRHRAGRAPDAARVRLRDPRPRLRRPRRRQPGGWSYAIRVALDRWEPRIDVAGVDFDLERADAGELLIEITYELRATNDVRNLVYPFYVIPAEETA